MLKIVRVFRCGFSRSFSRDIRVRFAPSPTGYLHLGGLRTALYNYLFAKLNNGKFILRIEDTDQSRLVPAATEHLQQDLKWSGIEIDEGPEPGGEYGPYIQSQRTHIYKDQVHVLLENGSAYHCFCTDRRLDLLRKEAVRARQMPKYDNRCRHLAPEEVTKRLNRGEKYCIRFKLKPDCETFEDLIFGNIAYDVALNEGDPVIMKSDGFPTYHFANVVDDHFMRISHVLRGVEWQISTTKHILLYRAFNWEPPVYGHLPLLLNADGTKLSKRQGDIKIAHYRETGILPLALINFIACSGGGFSKDRERGHSSKSHTMMELVDQFNIDNVNSHSGKLMPERLLEFNRLELERQMSDERSIALLVQTLQQMIKEKFSEKGDALELDVKHIEMVLRWSLSRIERLSDLVENNLRFLWVVPNTSREDVDESLLKPLENFLSTLTVSNLDLDKDDLNSFLKGFAQQNGIGFSKFMKSLRTVLSGLKEGPGVAEMMVILGKENTEKRLQSFLRKAKGCEVG